MNPGHVLPNGQSSGAGHFQGAVHAEEAPRFERDKQPGRPVICSAGLCGFLNLIYCRVEEIDRREVTPSHSTAIFYSEQ